MINGTADAMCFIITTVLLTVLINFVKQQFRQYFQCT